MAMRTWNHRILAFDSPHGVYFEAQEVHYADGVPRAYSVDKRIGGESIEDILWTCDMIKKACEKPILWGGDRFPQEYKPQENG